MWQLGTRIGVRPTSAGYVQEIKEEPVYYIHYANAFDDGDVTVLRGSAWGPDTVKRLAENPGGGILGSWADILEGNFSAVSELARQVHHTPGLLAMRQAVAPSVPKVLGRVCRALCAACASVRDELLEALASRPT